MSENSNSIDNVLRDFLHNIDSLNATLPVTMMVIGELLKKEDARHKVFLKKHGTLEHTEDGTSTYTLAPKHFGEEKRIIRLIQQYITSVDLIPRTFLVSFVSDYDAFLGRLIKTYYTKKPDLLNGLDKQIAFGELLSFKNLDEAKEYILEKEVEGILRKSHAEHFEILEKKHNIKLREKLEIWPEFIELMERRNLFVHCDGVVSNQYISVCKEHGHKWETEPAIGARLTVDSAYLKNASSIIREMAIKLCHVLWRKIFPNEREAADDALLRLTYELIQHERYHLAIKVLEFAVSLPKHHDDNFKRMFLINLAQSYKYSENNKKCEELLAGQDWSSVTYKFKMAVAVLQGKHDDAARFMEKSSLTSELTEQNFLEWPLFKEFRATDQFKNTFEKLYKKPIPSGEEIVVTAAAAAAAADADESRSNSTPVKKVARKKPPSAKATSGATKIRPKKV